jgi:hypothetical protein
MLFCSYGFLQFCEQEQHTKFYLRALMATPMDLDFREDRPRDIRCASLSFAIL